MAVTPLMPLNDTGTAVSSHTALVPPQWCSFRTTVLPGAPGGCADVIQAARILSQKVSERLYVFRGKTGTVFVINLCHSIFGPIPVLATIRKACTNLRS